MWGTTIWENMENGRRGKMARNNHRFYKNHCKTKKRTDDTSYINMVSLSLRGTIRWLQWAQLKNAHGTGLLTMSIPPALQKSQTTSRNLYKTPSHNTRYRNTITLTITFTLQWTLLFHRQPAASFFCGFTVTARALHKKCHVPRSLVREDGWPSFFRSKCHF